MLGWHRRRRRWHHANTRKRVGPSSLLAGGRPEAKAYYVVFGFSWPDVSEWNSRGGILVPLSPRVTGIGRVDSAALCSWFVWRLGSFRDRSLACAGFLEPHSGPRSRALTSEGHRARGSDPAKV